MPEGSEILELAATSGLISAYLASKGYKTTVTNLDEDLVKIAREYYERNGLQGKFQILDIFAESESVGFHDVVFVVGALDHYDGRKAVQILEKMKELGRYVVVLSQNPKCTPYLLYNKVAKEKGDLQELSIFRQSFADLAELAGLEVVKETYFSAASLSKWMAGMVSSETAEAYADSIEHNLIPEDQQHFKVLIAKKAIMEMEADEKIALYKRAFESEIEAFRRSYDFDIHALNERISNLDDELVTRINSIRQLELIQQYGNMMIKTPMGLLLSLYYQRADLQEAFPEVVNHDYKRLLQWAKETVEGKTKDSNTDKLLTFADWYKQSVGNLHALSNLEQIRIRPRSRISDPVGLSYPIPSQELLNEILGVGATSESYLQGGFIVSSGLRSSIYSLGKDISNFKRVLEFGCGSARVLRWFADMHENTEFFGVDISAKAINWCKENINFGKFMIGNPLPPLSFTENHFDMIYAISVFTHLDEEFQFAWLKELQRISQPGAIIMLTIHGDDKAEMALSDKEFAEFQNKGFLYKKASSKGGVDGGPDFYQVAYHSRKYIETIWTKFFKVLGYFKHGTMWHQDLVILENNKGAYSNEESDQQNYSYVNLPIAFIENPKFGEIVKESMNVTGWAFRPHSDRLELDVLIDGEQLGTCTTNLLRKDLERAYLKHPNAKFAGFTSSISTSRLKPGFHTLSISIRGNLDPIMVSYFVKA